MVVAFQPPPQGVWCPAVTLFKDESDSLDLEAQAAYFSYLSRTGLAGLVILGTNAETFLLTREERKQLVQTARKSVPSEFPLMVGIGGHSTAQVLEFLADAEDAGANFVLVLPPAYFKTASMDRVIEDFYHEISMKSSVPIVLYNFPGVCNGVDMDSTMITKLAQRHPNIVGVKLTCGSVAKITRLRAAFRPERFAVFGGQSDFLIGGLSVGSAGCIAAFANVFPKTICQIYRLFRSGQTDEALHMHQIAALAEVPCKAGIASTKYAAAIFTAPRAGIKNAPIKFRPRHPYSEPAAGIKEDIRTVMQDVNELEESLQHIQKNGV